MTKPTYQNKNNKTDLSKQKLKNNSQAFWLLFFINPLFFT